jgi:UDP-N-acetylglucosamine 2-epimerase (non-hydrolysing)/GDP/UDP-N,N'-diacetylbacillosamine 2-epimerase (hydrolysing)
MSDFTGVTIVSNSRAEDGPLESVIKAMPGCSVTRFNSDGMSPAVAVAQAVIFFTVAFKTQDLKLVVLLGDRYEMLAAGLAAMFMKIPVAHIHGGETTTGAFDDALRHSITHISELNFVSTDSAREVVADLNHITGYDCGAYLVGAPGLDGVQGNSAKRDRKIILVTYHPETMLPDNGVAQCEAMLNSFKTYCDDYDIIFTGVNNDPGSNIVRTYIAQWVNMHFTNAVIKENLDHKAYIALMQSAAVVVGNSSAGVIEAPWVGIPSVNIGKRQNGRPMASSVCKDIETALKWSGPWIPIYRGGASEKIAAKIKEWLGDAE